MRLSTSRFQVVNAGFAGWAIYDGDILIGWLVLSPRVCSFGLGAREGE